MIVSENPQLVVLAHCCCSAAGGFHFGWHVADRAHWRSVGRCKALSAPLEFTRSRHPIRLYWILSPTEVFKNERVRFWAAVLSVTKVKVKFRKMCFDYVLLVFLRRNFRDRERQRWGDQSLGFVLREKPPSRTLERSEHAAIASLRTRTIHA